MLFVNLCESRCPDRVAMDDLGPLARNLGAVSAPTVSLATRFLCCTEWACSGSADVEETGATFEENALLKARQMSAATGLPAIADDSGLCVDALGGDPGIFSAIWAGPKKDFLKASKDIEKKLIEIGSSNYSAYFICALAVCWPDGESRIFKGKINGNLNFPPKGNLGFGYDPIFIPRNYDITFGEMDPIIKHKISHRSVAFDLFSRELLVEKE